MGLETPCSNQHLQKRLCNKAAQEAHRHTEGVWVILPHEQGWSTGGERHSDSRAHRPAHLSQAQKQDDIICTNRFAFLQEMPWAHSEGLLENQDPGQALMHPHLVVMEQPPKSVAPAYLQDVVLPEQQPKLPEKNHSPIRRGPPLPLRRTLEERREP